MGGITTLLISAACAITTFVLGFYIGNIRGYRAGIEIAAEAILDEEEEKMQEAFNPDCGWR